ncbi:MAG: hypothetical protein II410_08200 [Ruminococcus sp.]|nr:hypothetical protein [Ruminococcus sp.]MBQ2443143.1 hypothetical protein [Ruminococcus sp.]MBQ4171641.1 hypothetical protein [Ruminococcus sp.]MBQ4260299.1 hypothetical protein [Ruminococcus sp.]
MRSTTIKVKIDRNGNVRRVIGDVGQTRMNKAANELWRGNIEPTFGYKLRRFIRRFAKTANHWFDEAAQIALGTDVPASEIEYIGLLEDGARI